MGKLAARGARARGATLKLTSRRDASAAEAAAFLDAEAVPFDPGAAALDDVTLVIVALSGPWILADETIAALGRVPAIVDLSQPGATPRPVVPTLTLDDLTASAAADPVDERFRARLAALRDDAISEYGAWLDRRASAAVAGALAGRIEVDRRAELEALWRRRPDLGDDERAEIEALTRRLAERLFREPFERLGRDAAGRREQAARELFGL
jgi:glutamyl-tRNA reductase